MTSTNPKYRDIKDAMMDNVPIADGDLLPMVGGPLDGYHHAVNFVMSMLNGGVAPGAWSCRINGKEYFYTLDQANHCWKYQEPPCNVSN